MIELDPVRDPAAVARIGSRVRPLVSAPWELDAKAATARGWVVVPVEKGRHFEPELASRAAFAAAEVNAPAGYAWATEPMGEYTSCYDMPFTAAGFLAFSAACATLNFAVFPPDLGFLILCTSEDYNLYAGPVPFVERATGMTVAQGRSAFAAYADDPWWDGRLRRVLDKYSPPA